MSLNFIIAWKNNKWYNKRVLIWHFTLVLIKINYGQIGDQKSSFKQQTQYFIQDSTNVFPDRINFYRFVRQTGIFGNLWLLLTHKPVRLLTSDILEVHGRFYWPGLSGLWLNSKIVYDNIIAWDNKLFYCCHLLLITTIIIISNVQKKMYFWQYLTWYSKFKHLKIRFHWNRTEIRTNQKKCGMHIFWVKFGIILTKSEQLAGMSNVYTVITPIIIIILERFISYLLSFQNSVCFYWAQNTNQMVDEN